MGRPTLRGISTIAVALGGVAAILLTGPAAATAASSVPGTVSVKGSVALRANPSSTAVQVGNLKNKAKLNIACQVVGDTVKGKVRKTDKWDLLTNGQYVSDAFIKRNTRIKVAICPPPATVPTLPAAADPNAMPELDGVAPPGTWTIPVPKTIIGGFRTVARPQHDGVDLPHARETPIRSAADGVVVTVRCNASTPTCDVDGSTTTTGCGWYVEVRHANDIVTRYCHMVRQPAVQVGDKVTVGQVIGFVGTSGHSSGTHLHFEVHRGYPANHENAIDPVPFMQKVGAPLA
jgi:murein DD-endopeptidase MepM/ murein hydrolase activator NlpD